jgi:catechol 2,3-dioxygenase-like lactoylglutathione lyase family enzyme
VRIAFVAGFGPITTDATASLTFWRDDIGLPMEEIAPEYWGTDDVPGVKAFAAWPLAQAAESCFGTATWPEHVSAPQAWLEVDVLNGDAVGEAAAELEAAGHRLLKQATTEPWGQTVARLLSPEGVLVGITFTPWMHKDQDDSGADGVGDDDDGDDDGEDQPGA